MRKLLFVSFLAISSGSYVWSATVVPTVGVTTPNGTTDFLLTPTSCATSTDVAGVSTCFSGNGTGNGFTWSLSGDEDPFLSWGFTSTVPGTYTVTFLTPIVGGLSYNMLVNAASLTITNLTNAPTTVTNIDVMAEVPAGNNIAGVELIDAGPVTAGAFNFANASLGPATVNTPFPTPASMEVVLSYTATGTGSVGFVGQALLTETTTPEPNNLAVAGLGMLAVLFLGRRKFRKA